MAERGTAEYPFPAVPRAIRPFVAVAFVALIFLAYHGSAAIVDDGSLFLLLSVAVLGSAWLAGTGTALTVTVAGAVLGAVFARPQSSPALEMHLALFVVHGLLLTALVAELRRAREQAIHEAGMAQAARMESEAANRMKDEFLGTISHELRTPLNAVLGWLHLIRTGKLDAATETRGFECIERNVRHQAQLTADLLDVSAALTGRLTMEMRPVALMSVVAEAMAQVKTAATAKDVQLDLSAPERSVVVRGDANRLRQVIWQLLANAIKFTPRGGAIAVTVESNDHVCVTVRDSGPGIAPEFLPRIFERFTQADSSPTRSVGGLGVGLSLVRELVERHGGEIRAGNAPEGGAMFTIQLPIHRADQTARPARPAPAVPPGAVPPLNGVRVLLLDRDKDARDLLSVALEQRGATVQTAFSVAQALEMLEAWRPDVLVSDSPASERNGYMVVGKVQSLETDRGGRIPALALTSMSSTDAEMRRLLSDVTLDLPKPVEPAILTAEIARLTGRERRQARR
ncbi:MAG TPA: hybrid sensor histidine kinase/response regulator [Vicinamibacterales bacterium]|nr:hybrid sensor histidine kinase/response regulator [Vicinamibacterales bacterium]